MIQSKERFMKKIVGFLSVVALAGSIGCAGTVGSLNKEYGISEGDKKKIEAATEEKEKDAKEGKSIPRMVLLYPVNRVLDLFDIFRLNVGVGPGFGLNLRATKFVQVGLENYFSLRAGLGKRGGLLVPRYGIFYTETELLTMGVGPLYTGGWQRGMTEVGGTVHLGIAGADAAIDLSEILDFLGGFVFIDFKGDDF